MRKKQVAHFGLFLVLIFSITDFGICSDPTLKAIQTYPKENGKFLDSVTWLSKPLPNPENNPFLIITAQYKESGEEEDFILDLKSGERLRLPSPMDLVGTPDGKFFTIPGTYSGGKGILFYSAIEFLKTLRTKGQKGIRELKPVFRDTESRGHHSLFGTFIQKNKNPIYRTLLGGNGPFHLVDYEISDSKQGVKIERKVATQLCSNLPHFADNGSATLSRDAHFAALFEPHSRAVKVYELTLQDGKSICREVANTGIAAGKADFSPDGKWLVLHVLNATDPGRKELLLVELIKNGDNIQGVGKKILIPLSSPESTSAYFPSFLSNGMLFYIRENILIKNGHRFEVIDPSPLMKTKTTQAEPNSPPQYCNLEPHNAKVLFAYPREKNRFLESIAWMARPFPNNAGRPHLIGYAEFMEDGLERNFLLDLATGEKLVVPGQGDPVATPDGKYLSIPGLNEGSRGLTFYEAKPFFEALKKKNKEIVKNLKPIFNDPEINGYCQSFGITHKEKGKTRYRTIHSRGGPFQLTEYLATDSHGKTQFERISMMPLCDNLPKREEHGTASISKDGNLISLFDFASNSTKIYSLKVENGKANCQEIFDLGIPTGALDFSYDGKKIAFHVTFLDIDYADNTSMGVPSTKIKDVILAELEEKDGKITGLGKMTRLTNSMNAGEGSYFPSFFPNGKLFYVHHDRGRGSDDHYRFEVIHPKDARYEIAPFSRTPTPELTTRLLSKIILGRLWLKSCQRETLTPTQSALYAMSLKPEDCETLLKSTWISKKAEILAELKSTDTLLNWKSRGFDQIKLEEKLSEAQLQKACQN